MHGNTYVGDHIRGHMRQGQHGTRCMYYYTRLSVILAALFSRAYERSGAAITKHRRQIILDRPGDTVVQAGGTPRQM
jgi:hypothetical protein